MATSGASCSHPRGEQDARSSVRALEKSLAGAHEDNKRMRSHMERLCLENLSLTSRLSTTEAELGKVGTELATVAEERKVSPWVLFYNSFLLSMTW